MIKNENLGSVELGSHGDASRLSLNISLELEVRGTKATNDNYWIPKNDD